MFMKIIFTYNMRLLDIGGVRHQIVFGVVMATASKQLNFSFWFLTSSSTLPSAEVSFVLSSERSPLDNCIKPRRDYLKSQSTKGSSNFGNGPRQPYLKPFSGERYSWASKVRVMSIKTFDKCRVHHRSCLSLPNACALSERMAFCSFSLPQIIFREKDPWSQIKIERLFGNERPGFHCS